MEWTPPDGAHYAVQDPCDGLWIRLVVPAETLSVVPND